MALIGLMGFLLYGACGSEKKEIPKQIYIVAAYICNQLLWNRVYGSGCCPV